MLTRRDFLARSLKASTLLACAPAVPQFLAATASAAEQEKDGTVLVVLEMGGGNDGLNTVIPYADDLYHKARPTLRMTKKNVMKVNDHIGLHISLFGLQNMLNEGQLAVVQGVGYPNPDNRISNRWTSGKVADVTRANLTGWLGRAVRPCTIRRAAYRRCRWARTSFRSHSKRGRMPVSLNQQVPYELEFGPGQETPSGSTDCSKT